jgi:hypothetical protein
MSITKSQVQELLQRIPETKLPCVYRLLQELAAEDDALSPQAAFLRLAPEERSRLLAEQAQEMKAHYEQSADERQDWQSGDFQDEH